MTSDTAAGGACCALGGYLWWQGIHPAFAVLAVFAAALGWVAGEDALLWARHVFSGPIPAWVGVAMTGAGTLLFRLGTLPGFGAAGWALLIAGLVISVSGAVAADVARMGQDRP